MTLWRLELLRLVRTRRWLVLLGVFVFFGLLGPISARYLKEIVEFAGGDLEGATLVLPDPVPLDGMRQYVSNTAQIGTLVAVVVAAGALAFDTIEEMGIFLRTRVGSVWTILAPRLVVSTAATVVAFVAGAVVAWYETWALIGGLSPGPVLAGIGFGVLFFLFVVAVVAAVAGWARSVLATVMGSIVILLAMPVFGIVDVVNRWLPTHLGGALADLPGGGGAGADYWPAATVAVLGAAFLVWLGGVGAQRRQL